MKSTHQHQLANKIHRTASFIHLGSPPRPWKLQTMLWFCLQTVSFAYLFSHPCFKRSVCQASRLHQQRAYINSILTMSLLIGALFSHFHFSCNIIIMVSESRAVYVYKRVCTFAQDDVWHSETLSVCRCYQAKHTPPHRSKAKEWLSRTPWRTIPGEWENDDA